MAGKTITHGKLIAKKITHTNPANSEYMCPFCHAFNRMHEKRCRQCSACKKIRADLKYCYRKASGSGIPDSRSAEELLDHLRHLRKIGEF
jgi:hypothetical protein